MIRTIRELLTASAVMHRLHLQPKCAVSTNKQDDEESIATVSITGSVKRPRLAATYPCAQPQAARLPPPYTTPTLAMAPSKWMVTPRAALGRYVRTEAMKLKPSKYQVTHESQHYYLSARIEHLQPGRLTEFAKPMTYNNPSLLQNGTVVFQRFTKNHFDV